MRALHLDPERTNSGLEAVEVTGSWILCPTRVALPNAVDLPSGADQRLPELLLAGSLEYVRLFRTPGSLRCSCKRIESLLWVMEAVRPTTAFTEQLSESHQLEEGLRQLRHGYVKAEI
jgi:hypothetical protein